MAGLLLFLLTAMAVFLILLVLVQRGRGGGLTGALGGMGGQSAFGTKAGDTFTKITMWTAFLWIVLCVVSVKVLTAKNTNLPDAPKGLNAPPAPLNPGQENGGGAAPADRDGQPATPSGGGGGGTSNESNSDKPSE